MSTAYERAQLVWGRKASNVQCPVQCRYCGRRFTERGITRHLRSCWKNPESKRFTEGGWDGCGEWAPIWEGAKIVGHMWRGENELQERAVRRSYIDTMTALGDHP